MPRICIFRYQVEERGNHNIEINCRIAQVLMARSAWNLKWWNEDITKDWKICILIYEAPIVTCGSEV
jgi:hypothetical protein